MSHGADHFQTSQSKQRFLSQTVVLIASVQVVRQSPILWGVFLDGSIHEERGNHMPGDAPDVVLPDPDSHVTAFNRNIRENTGRAKMLTGIPRLRLLYLRSVRIEPLSKVTFPVHQRHGYHG